MIEDLTNQHDPAAYLYHLVPPAVSHAAVDSPQLNVTASRLPFGCQLLGHALSSRIVLALWQMLQRVR